VPELREGETVEFKEQWSPTALEDLAAFANHRGGTLYVGVSDGGEVVGFGGGDPEVRRIANQIHDLLGLAPALRPVQLEGREVLEVGVEPSVVPVACRGRYLVRVGSTNRTMPGEEIARRFMQRTGQTWDGLPSPWGPEEADAEALARFVGRAGPWLPVLSEGDPPERVLENLGLLREGRLTHAGVLLFARKPQRLFPSAVLRAARFRGTLISGERTFDGSLWEQLDGVMEYLRDSLDIQYRIEPEGLSVEELQRQEVWPYPHEALREAVLNALMHRDYADPGDIQVRLYPDRLSLWNPGELYGGLTVEVLRREDHPSRLRNPAIAQVFYYAGLVERWGSGITRMRQALREQGLPEPEMAEEAGGFRLTLLKDAYTPELLRARGLSERQVRGVMYAKEHGGITNREYQEVAGVSKRTASRDLEQLTGWGILERVGETGKGTRYVLKGPGRGQRGQEGATKGSNRTGGSHA